MEKLTISEDKPARKKSFPTYPPVGKEEIEELSKVLKRSDGHLWSSTLGDTARELEKELADYVRVRAVTVTNTGGMALQIALRASGLQPGSGVLFQVDTCYVEAFAVFNAGYVPVFADIDPYTGGLSKESIEETLKKKDLRIRAIIAIHTWGKPEDMDMIKYAVRKYDLRVVEDCCQTLGAKWKGRNVGTIGDIGFTSFGWDKPIQAGEGGAIFTNTRVQDRICKSLRTWGAPEVAILSENGRVSEFVSAVALAQLRKYPLILTRIQENASLLEEFIKGTEGLSLIGEDPRIQGRSYTRFLFKMDAKKLGISNRLFCRALNLERIPAWPGNYPPICKSYRFYSSGEWKKWVSGRVDTKAISRNYHQRYPEAEELFSQTVSLPRTLFLKKKDVIDVIKAMGKVLRNSGRLKRLERH